MYNKKKQVTKYRSHTISDLIDGSVKVLLDIVLPLLQNMQQRAHNIHSVKTSGNLWMPQKIYLSSATTMVTVIKLIISQAKEKQKRKSHHIRWPIFLYLNNETSPHGA